MADVTKDNLVRAFQDFIDDAIRVRELLSVVDESLAEAVGDEDSALNDEGRVCFLSNRLDTLTDRLEVFHRRLEVFHRRLDSSAARVDRARDKTVKAVGLCDSAKGFIDECTPIAAAEVGSALGDALVDARDSIEAASILASEAAGLLAGLNLH